MKYILGLFLLSCISIQVAKSQNDEMKLEILYQKQFDQFYNNHFESSLNIYDSIQILTSNASIESIQLAITTCLSLIELTKISSSKELLIVKKEYLEALLKYKKSTLRIENSSQIKPINDEDKFRSNYNQLAIYFGKKRIIQNGIGYTIYELEDEFMKFEDSKHEYLIARRKHKVANRLAWVGLALYASGLATLDLSGWLGGSLLVGSLGTVITSGVFGNNSSLALRKAAWHYNREITIKGSDYDLRFKRDQ